MIKRLTSLALSFVFLLSAVFFYPNMGLMGAAETASPVDFYLVGPEGNETLNADTFELSVCINVPEGLPGGGIGGVEVNLLYTSFCFKTTAQEITIGNGLANTENNIAFIPNGIKFIYEDMNTVLTTGEYTLFTVQFTIADITPEGEHNFRLETPELFDNSVEMNDIPSNNGDLDIYVGSRPDEKIPSVAFGLTGPEGNDSHGEETLEISVSINISEEIAALGIGGMNVLLSYNGSCFGASPKDIVLEDAIKTGESHFAFITDGITFIYDGLNAEFTPGEHTLFTVTFAVADNTPEGKYGFRVDALELFDNTMGMNDILSVNHDLDIYVGEKFEITAEKTTLYVGETVQISANKSLDSASNLTEDIFSYDGSSITALKPGEGELIFYAKTGQAASARIHVYEESARLAALSVANGVLSPAFAPGVYQYSVTIPQADNSLDIHTSAVDPNAVINIANNTIGIGETKDILITLTSGRGAMQQTYIISATREAPPEVSIIFEAYSAIYMMNKDVITAENLDKIDEAIGVYHSLTDVQKERYANEYASLTANKGVATLDRDVKAVIASPAAYAIIKGYADDYASAGYTNSSISGAIAGKTAEVAAFAPRVLGGTIKTSSSPDKQDLKFNVNAPASKTYDGMFIREYGVIFLPTNILGGSELKIETPKIAIAKGLLEQGEIIPELFNANLGSSAASDARCARDISARAYVIWTDGTSDYLLYSVNSEGNIKNGTAVRSVYGIARAMAAAINGTTKYGTIYYSDFTVPKGTTNLAAIPNLNILKFVFENVSAIQAFVNNQGR